MRAAEVLRAGAPEAEITLIGDETQPPYDRPPLSKAFLTGGLAPAKLLLKPESFYPSSASRCVSARRRPASIARRSGSRSPMAAASPTTRC